MAKHTVKRKYIEATTEDRDAEVICAMIEKKMRSVEPESSGCYDAKSLLLFGNSLFPENFRMKLQSYQMAKSASDVDKAAQLFRVMYLSFPNEQSFYAELCAIIEEVRTEQQSNNTEMFHRLSKSLQCEILLKFCPTFSNILDELGLKVFIMRNYPLTIREHVFDVVDTLTGLERESYPGDPLNVYRERLVCDVLPLLFQHMAKKKEMDGHLASDLLFKALTFLLAYGVLRTSEGKPPLLQGCTKEHVRLKDPWLLARQLMEAVSSYYSWGSLSLPRLPRPGSSSSTGSQSSEEFIFDLDQALQNTRAPQRLVLPLLVAYVESATRYLHVAKPSFLATGPERSKSSAPAKDIWMCSFGEEGGATCLEDEEDTDMAQASHWFELALKIWRHLARLNKDGRKEWDDLARKLRSDSWRWLQIFNAEAAAVAGAAGPRECSVQSEKVAALVAEPARSFLEAQAGWQVNKARAVSALLLCLQALRRAEPSCPFPHPQACAASVAARPVRLSFAWLFSFALDRILTALLAVCRRVTSWQHTAAGHALVLLQWPLSAKPAAPTRLTELAALLQIVRQVGKLEYPRFFDFVVRPELLEEVVALQGTTLLLSPQMQGTDADADRQELAKTAQLQIEKSHTPLGPLLFDFLLTEAESLSNCFS